MASVWSLLRSSLLGWSLLGWNLSIAAAFAAAVWLLCRTPPLRRRPALCHGLWFLVLLKLVTPPLFPVPVLRPVSAEMAAAPEPPAGRVEPLVPRSGRPAELATIDGSAPVDSPSIPLRGEKQAVAAASPVAASPVVGSPVVSLKVVSLTDAPPWRRMIGPILLDFSLLMTVGVWLLALRQFVRAGRLLRQAASAPERAVAVLRELTPLFRNRRAPVLVVVEDAITPMLWAAPRRAAIVLPRQMAEALDENQLRGVIGHELAHLARRDGWVQLFAFVVTSLQWWNPCAWLARREMQAAAEACCDALVLETLPGLRKTYARSLLAVVDFVTLGRPLRSPLSVAFGESCSLRRRIAMVASDNVKARTSAVGWGLLACTALLLCAFPTLAQEKQSPKDASSPALPSSPSAPSSSANAGKSAPAKRASRELKLPQHVAPDEIAGVVVDAQGKPLADVLVDAWTWFPGDETKTDADGAFRLKPEDSDAQYVEIRFSKPGYSPHYVVQQPRGKQGVVIVLGNKTYLEGTLRGPGHQPVAGGTIKGLQGEKQADGVMIGDVTTSTKSDANGHYRLYLFPDLYEIRVAVPGVGARRLSGITVAPDEAKKLDIDLKPAVRFEAKVVDAVTRKPLDGLVLFNWREPEVVGVSDADGKIAIDGMLPGKCEFSVGHGKPKSIRGMTYYDHGELGRWWSAQAVNEWERKTMDEGDWQRNFDSLTFNISVGMKPVTIEVERGVVFSGHVYDPDGKPVAGATVAPARTGSGNSLTGDTRYSERTAKDGSYRVVMPAGNKFAYNLVAHDGDHQEWRKWGNGVSEPLTTRPNQRFEHFDLRLTRGATVRGRVIAEGGRVVGAREVRAEAADLRENRYYDPTVKVRPDGTFELRFIRPGKHHIQVSPFWLAAANAPNGTSFVLNLKEGEIRDGIELHVAPSAEPVTAALSQRTFRVTVLDRAGKPAANQRLAVGTRLRQIALTSLVGNRQGLAQRKGSDLAAGEEFTTGPDGTVSIPGGQLFERNVTVATVAAINADRAEGAIGVLYADLQTPEITLRLAPLCDATCSISTKELPSDASGSLAYLHCGAASLLFAPVVGGKVELQLPPGAYRLTLSNPMANPQNIHFTIKPDRPEFNLGLITLTPTRLANLVGKPAPELRGIAEWRNGTPVKLSELRDKIVLLDFWGYWCGPCLASMPSLMKIYDAYPGKEVAIIAVHDGSLKNLDQLREKTATARKELWKGRELPFRIALGGGGSSKIEGSEFSANCQVVADYGIHAFPTTLLIDRRGKVAAISDPRDVEGTKKKIAELLRQ